MQVFLRRAHGWATSRFANVADPPPQTPRSVVLGVAVAGIDIHTMRPRQSCWTCHIPSIFFLPEPDLPPLSTGYESADTFCLPKNPRFLLAQTASLWEAIRITLSGFSGGGAQGAVLLERRTDTHCVVWTRTPITLFVSRLRHMPVVQALPRRLEQCQTDFGREAAGMYLL